jgi:hypothetical protein
LDAEFINKKTNPHNPNAYLMVGIFLFVVFSYSVQYMYFNFGKLKLMANGVEMSSQVLNENYKIIDFQIVISLVSFLIAGLFYYLICTLLSSGMI